MPIFDAAEPLPRGPHQLGRERVAASQRSRLMAAFTELLADGGYAAATIGALAQRAGVSRGAFYEHFADKEACLLAAYDHFAETLLAAMPAEIEPDTPWSAFVRAALEGYLGTLEREPVAARAFLVEMDAAGAAARERRRAAMHLFADVLGRRHAAFRRADASLGPLPARTWLGLVLAVRELAREALERERAPRLTELVPDVETWVTATIRGAAPAS